MTISHIDNAELGFTVREKLNELIDLANVKAPLPYFGNIPISGWTRPAGTTFSTFLNKVDSLGAPNTEPTTATLTDNAGGLPLVYTAGVSANTPRGYFPSAALKSIGAPPWTITSAFAAFSNRGNSSTFPFFPIILYDSADQLAEVLNWAWYPESNTQVGQYTGVNDLNIISFSNASPGGYGFLANDYFGWFRVVHDGTNIIWSISPDGLLFKNIYSELANSFLGTIDKVGFGFDRGRQGVDSAGFYNVSGILWQWIES